MRWMHGMRRSVSALCFANVWSCLETWAFRLSISFEGAPVTAALVLPALLAAEDF